MKKHLLATAAIAFLIAGIGIIHLASSCAAPPPATSPAENPPRTVNVDAAIIQRQEDTLRLLNTTIKIPGTNELRHVDLTLHFSVNKEGKVSVDSFDTKPTSLIGVGALVAGTYSDGKLSYDIKGPAFDVDSRAIWSIEGRTFYGSVVAGPIPGHPQLAAVKGTEDLPQAGVYGLVYHDRAFAGFANSPKTLVNLRQVEDTIVITAYAPNANHYEQTGSVVLRKK